MDERLRMYCVLQKKKNNITRIFSVGSIELKRPSDTFFNLIKGLAIPAMLISIMGRHQRIGPSSIPCRYRLTVRGHLYYISPLTVYVILFLLSHIDSLWSLEHAYKGHPWCFSRRVSWRGPVTPRSGGPGVGKSCDDFPQIEFRLEGWFSRCWLRPANVCRSCQYGTSVYCWPRLLLELGMAYASPDAQTDWRKDPRLTRVEFHPLANSYFFHYTNFIKFSPMF
jgi:hypothetical protein